MSRDGSITAEFGGRDEKFRLGLAELEELQDVTGRGPEWLANRFRDGDWRVKDLRQVLRIGLIGGGLDLKDAEARCRRYFDEIPRLIDHKSIAFTLLMTALLGPEEDPPGKLKGRQKATTKKKQDSLLEDGDLLTSTTSEQAQV